jgi:hypothetical protein
VTMKNAVSGIWCRVDLIWTDVPPKRRFTQDHGATSKKTAFFKMYFCWSFVHTCILAINWQYCKHVNSVNKTVLRITARTVVFVTVYWNFVLFLVTLASWSGFTKGRGRWNFSSPGAPAWGGGYQPSKSRRFWTQMFIRCPLENRSF